MKLADLIPDEGHLVVVTGCLTCPRFLMSHRDVEAVAHDYRSSTHPERYVVRLEADRTAGMAQGRWERGGARGPRGANPGNAEPTPLARMDADGDGRGAQDSSGNDGEV